LAVSSALVLLALPTVLSAQTTTGTTRPVTIGISAGLSQPIGDFGDAVKTGYAVQGHVGFEPATLPVGFRADAIFHQFGFDNVDANYRILGGNGNIVFRVPTQGGVRPYVLGGVGLYNLKANYDDAIVPGQTLDASTTKFGVNAGGGIEFALSGFTTFVEARLHNVFADFGSSGSSLRTIPLTFGLKF
jgi:opacity protein-like surface antigen